MIIFEHKNPMDRMTNKASHYICVNRQNTVIRRHTCSFRCSFLNFKYPTWLCCASVSASVCVSVWASVCACIFQYGCVHTFAYVSLTLWSSEESNVKSCFWLIDIGGLSLCFFISVYLYLFFPLFLRLCTAKSVCLCRCVCQAINQGFSLSL